MPEVGLPHSAFDIPCSLFDIHSLRPKKRTEPDLAGRLGVSELRC